MDDPKKAQEMIIECCEIIDKVKETRTDILIKKGKFESKLDGLNADLGRALVQAMFGSERPAEVNLIRKEIRDAKAFLGDAELILESLESLRLEKIEEKRDPQQIVRNFAEDERQRKLNMSLQQQLLRMAAESENFMHKDDFKKVAERFKKNALSLGQEEAAARFVQSLKG